MVGVPGADPAFLSAGPIVAAVALAVLWTVEATAPMFVGRRRRISHVATNLGLAVANAVVSHFFAFAVFGVTGLAAAQGFGLTRWFDLPTWGQWVFALLAFDCWQYWWHRMNHRIGFLWRFHAVHHSDGDMDASSGVRFHTVEIALSFAARLAVLPVIGMTVPQLLTYELISLPIILFHHANIRIPGQVDRALRWLIVTPWMHVVHHSRLQPETDSNYSSLLSVWDRLFGSFRLRSDPTTVAIGLDQWEEHEWRRLDRMLLKPFSRRDER